MDEMFGSLYGILVLQVELNQQVEQRLAALEKWQADLMDDLFEGEDLESLDEFLEEFGEIRVSPVDWGE